LLAVKSGFILFIKNYQFPLQINTLERERERERREREREREKRERALRVVKPFNRDLFLFMSIHFRISQYAR
jgi:hypothetical protein